MEPHSVDQSTTTGSAFAWEATTQQAKILAFKMCAKKRIEAGRNGKTIWICSDSEAALGDIGKIYNCFKLVMKTKASVKALGKDNRFNLIWIPGYSGWKGNEEANALG